MYKSKLQELCQQQKWGMPEYGTEKQGLDHNPRFQSKVVVNGILFDSQSLARSSKEAQNEAAKVAYNHFTLLSCPSAAPVSAATPVPAAAAAAAPELATGTSSSSFLSDAVNAGAKSHLTPSAPSTGEKMHVKIQELNQTSWKSGTTVLTNHDAIKVSAASTSTSKEVNLVGRASQPKLQESIQSPQGDETTLVAKSDDIFKDSPQLFKTQLQTYAQKRNLALPIYSCEREGPPHASRFRSQVTVDGKSYKCEEFFPTLSKAEQAAAKVALSLLPGVAEDECAYKNLLQELAQKRGNHFPTYSIRKFGEAHLPIFISTVEIGGECFTGQEARTKKQAEMSAAKVAYTSLKQNQTNIVGEVLQNEKEEEVGSLSPRPLSPIFWGERPDKTKKQRLSHPLGPNNINQGNSGQAAMCLSPAHQEQETPKFSSSSLPSELTTYLQKHAQPTLPVPTEHDGEDRASAEVTKSHLPASSLGLEGDSKMKGVPNCSASASYPALGSSCSPSADSSIMGIGVTIEHLVGRSSLCRNRVVIHPRETKVTYPADSTVLPISNDDWVAVKVTPPPIPQNMGAQL